MYSTGVDRCLDRLTIMRGVLLIIILAITTVAAQDPVTGNNIFDDTNNTTNQSSSGLDHDDVRVDGTLIQFNNRSNQYPVQVVLQSSSRQQPIDSSEAHQIHQLRLMLPPNGLESLCGDVASITSGYDGQRIGTLLDVSLVEGLLDDEPEYPIGLVVQTPANEENCTLHEKLQNVQYLNDNVLPFFLQIQYLMFPEDGGNAAIPSHNRTADDRSVVGTAAGSSDSFASNATTSDENATALIIWTSTEFIKDIVSTIETITKGNPTLLEEGNGNWTLHYVLQIGLNDASSSDDSNGYSDAANHIATFNLLFIVMVASCFIWSYCAKRRQVADEQANDAARLGEYRRRVDEKKQSLLTQSEFDSLPVVKYEMNLYEKLSATAAMTTTESSPATTESSPDTETPPTTTTTTSTSIDIDAKNESCPSNKTDTNDLNITRVDDVEAQVWETIKIDSNVVEGQSNNVTTCVDTEDDDSIRTYLQNQEELCGTCPICIDEFVMDESVIALPRCHHFYHKDCIQVWLLEKQSVCPLCKTDVFDDQQKAERKMERQQ